MCYIIMQNYTKGMKGKSHNIQAIGIEQNCHAKEKHVEFTRKNCN